MDKPEITTETMKISDVRSKVNTLVNEVFRHEKRVIVEKSGIPVAAIISVDDLERFEFLQGKRADQFQIVDEMQAAFPPFLPKRSSGKLRKR